MSALKWLTLVVGIGVLGAAITTGYLYMQIGKPLYHVGSVRAEDDLDAPLEPPAQTTAEEGFWDVGGGVQLRYFDEGSGNTVLVMHGGPGIPFTELWPGLTALASDYRFVFYDQRGSGASSRPIDIFDADRFYQNMMKLNRQLGLAAQIADIERIRRILGENKLTIV